MNYFMYFACENVCSRKVVLLQKIKLFAVSEMGPRNGERVELNKTVGNRGIRACIYIYKCNNDMSWFMKFNVCYLKGKFE